MEERLLDFLKRYLQNPGDRIPVYRLDQFISSEIINKTTAEEYINELIKKNYLKYETYSNGECLTLLFPL